MVPVAAAIPETIEEFNAIHGTSDNAYIQEILDSETNRFNERYVDGDRHSSHLSGSFAEEEIVGAVNLDIAAAKRAGLSIDEAFAINPRKYYEVSTGAYELGELQETGVEHGDDAHLDATYAYLKSGKSPYDDIDAFVAKRDFDPVADREEREYNARRDAERAEAARVAATPEAKASEAAKVIVKAKEDGTHAVKRASLLASREGKKLDAKEKELIRSEGSQGTLARAIEKGFGEVDLAGKKYSLAGQTFPLEGDLLEYATGKARASDVVNKGHRPPDPFRMPSRGPRVVPHEERMENDKVYRVAYEKALAEQQSA